jgi:hypothetical protein
MANGRMVFRRISTSEQLGRVSWQADMLFTKCIPHLDVNGRITGNATLLKSQVLPLRAEITAEMIPGLIRELTESKGHEGDALVVPYEANGIAALWFPGFTRIQKVRPEREATSKLPPPPPRLPTNSGVGPDLVRVQEQEEVYDQAQEGGAGNGGVPDPSAKQVAKALNDGMARNPAIGSPRSLVAPAGIVGKWRNDGIPLDLILQTVTRLGRDFRPNGKSRQIGSLQYCDKAVREAFAASAEDDYQWYASEARRGMDMADADKYPRWPQHEPRYKKKEVAHGTV